MFGRHQLISGAATVLALIVSSPAAAQDASPRFGTTSLATGIRLHHAEQGPSDGQAVILLHGYSDSWFSFSRILDALPPRLHVFALDQRGHGRSSSPASGYHMRDLARDVIAFMDAKGIERAAIVGHSMGSIVAQQVALAAPDRVERLVLVGSGPAFRNATDIDRLGEAVFGLTDPASVDFIRAFQESTVHLPVPAEFMETVISESQRLSAGVWKQLFAGMYATEAPRGLGATGIPVMIVWGELDSVFSRREQDALLGFVPNARHEVFRETGHAPHWERPERFAKLLSEFLTQKPATAAR